MGSLTLAGDVSVCVSVVTPRGRVDLALPSGVAVAELTLELVRHLDVSPLLELRDLVGERLDPDRPIGEQVRDGAVLQLVSGSIPAPQWFFDDPGEALTVCRSQVVTTNRRPWFEWGLVVGCALALIAALAGTLLLPAGPLVVLGSGVVSILLLVAGLSAVTRVGAWSTMFVWCASVYAAGSANLATGQLDSAWLPASVLAVIGCALIGMEQNRAWVLPVAVVAGGWLLLLSLMAAIRALIRATGTTWFGPADAATTVALLAVGLALIVIPRLSMAVAGLGPQLTDADEVRRSARRSELVLTLGLLSVGLAHLAAVPWAIALGLSGALLASVVSACFLLLARTLPNTAARGISLSSGAMSLTLGLVVALASQPSWRPMLIGLSLLVAVGIATGARSSGRSELRLALLADRAEWLARVSLLPLVVWSLGLVPWASRVVAP